MDLEVAWSPRGKEEEGWGDEGWGLRPPSFILGSLLRSPVCTAAASPSLTVWALEAQCADAEGGVWHAHTGASIEARCWREVMVLCVLCL